MHHASIIAFSKWARRHRGLFAMLLGITVLFNAAHVFAAVDFRHVPQTDAAKAGHMHEMPSSCCTGQCHNQSSCDQDTGCACMAHCASLWLSQQFNLLHHWHKSIPHFIAENIPVSYINPPPLQPPRV